MIRYLLLFDSYGLAFSGAPSLTRGRVCLLYMLLALASAVFVGSDSFGLDYFYCLRLETSLFVASYDSQGHGGGSRPRLHTGMEPSVTPNHTLTGYSLSTNSYKPSVGQRKTNIASLLRKRRVYRRCWGTLPRVVYCWNGRISVHNFQSAESTNLFHFRQPHHIFPSTALQILCYFYPQFRSIVLENIFGIMKGLHNK
jgi:hypothetical protein